MKPMQFVLLVLVASGIATQSVLAASISTRVKVVEDKVRLHDKKIREISAQQALTEQEIAILKKQGQREVGLVNKESSLVEPAAKAAEKKPTQLKLKPVKQSSPVKPPITIQPRPVQPAQLYKDPDMYAYP